jgi:HipA-like protein
MRTAEIYNNGVLAGHLVEDDLRHFNFTYTDAYLADSKQPAISVQLSKLQKQYHSNHLFPVFSNMVAEGVNLAIQSMHLKIDERDLFSLLLATAGADVIGSITVKPFDKSQSQ